MTCAVRVLYEDQAGQEIKGFGPHSLVVACVADDLGQDRWKLKHLMDAIPCKGKEKLLAKCREQGAAWVPPHGVLVAVFDSDAAYAAVKLAAGSCRRQILAAITTGSTAGSSLRVVLLERNVEDLVRAAAAALGQAVPSKKNLAERDSVLNAAADAGQAVRTAIRQALPSFDRLVHRVAEAVPPS